VTDLRGEDHGLRGHRRGCRCLTCRLAKSQRNSENYRRRMALRVVGDNGRLVAPAVTHGTATAYANSGCRCRPCTAAWSQRLRARRALGKSS
jgi:hypothetical protein